MNKKATTSKPKTTTRQKAKGCRRPSCSPIVLLRAVESARKAHLESRHKLMQWARLTTSEYEAMTCAVIATLIGVPQGFVEACLDVACDRVSGDVVWRKLENDKVSDHWERANDAQLSASDETDNAKRAAKTARHRKTLR